MKNFENLCNITKRHFSNGKSPEMEWKKFGATHGKKFKVINPRQVKAFPLKKHKYERHFLLRSSTVVFLDLGDNFLTLLHNFQIERNNVLLRFAEINKNEKPGLVCSIYGFFTKLKIERGHHCTNVFQGPSQFWIRAKIRKTRDKINIYFFYK